MARHPLRCSGFSRALRALFAVAAATHAAAQAVPLALADDPASTRARPVPLLVFAAASLADVIDENAADNTLQLKIAPGFDLAGALGRGRLVVGDPDSVPAGIYAHAALVKLEGV